MTFAKSNFARRLWAVRQTLFPSFERKGYHLQFRHGTLITIMLMAASFTLPANPQTRDFPQSDYSPSKTVPVESSYNLIHKHVGGIMDYNIAVAGFIALHLVVEPQFHRAAPVWFELTWMSLFVIGEAVCLGLMAASRPAVCEFNFGIDASIVTNGKFTAKNSATSICSNWSGMTGLLAAIIGVFLLHIIWHLLISIRHLNQRRSVFALPITDYRWTLPRPLERINETFPGDIEAPMSPVREGKLPEYSTDYTSKGTADITTATGTISFPVTAAAVGFSNYDRPARVSAKPASLDALPARSQPVVLEQSRTMHSDTSSFDSERGAGGSATGAALEAHNDARPSPPAPLTDAAAPFSNHARRV